MEVKKTATRLVYASAVTLLLLLLYGLAMTYSESGSLGVVCGNVLMLLIAAVCVILMTTKRGTIFVKKRSWILYVVGVVLILLQQYTPLGVVEQGQSGIGVDSHIWFRPSLFLVIATILFLSTLARLETKRRPSEVQWFWLYRLGVTLLSVCLLVACGASLCEYLSLILIAIIQNLMIDKKTLRKTLIVVFWLIVGAISFYIADRFLLFPLQESKELYQSVAETRRAAVEGIGLFGKGFGNSTYKQSSYFMSGDVWMVVAEELGVFGVLVLLALFCLLIAEVFLICKKAARRQNTYGKILALFVGVHLSLTLVLSLAGNWFYWPPSTQLPFFLKQTDVNYLLPILEIGVVQATFFASDMKRGTNRS